MKKKLMALVLATVMTLGMSTTAFAEGEETTPNYTNSVDNPNKVVTQGKGFDVTTKNTIKIYKDYEAKNSGTISPEETFTFGIGATDLKNAGVHADTQSELTLDEVKKSYMPVVKPITVAASLADQNETTKFPIEIELPDYKVVGEYTYEIKEVDNNVAGVTYHSTPITLVVTVQRDDTDNNDNAVEKLTATVHCEFEPDIYGDAASKDDTFKNVYSAGTLSVKKVVTGNMADKDKLFNVIVTLTSPADGSKVTSDISYTGGSDAGNTGAITEDWTGTKTINLKLKHDETVTFTNIPKDVTYTVVESDYTSEGYDAPVYDFKAQYKVNIAEGTADATVKTYEDDVTDKKIMGADVVLKAGGANITLQDYAYDHDVVITNNKEADVDTGIVTNNLPYIAVLAVVILAAVILMKRRNYTEM